MAELERNIDQGGIILFDIDEIEADCAEDGESHQIHLLRPLSDDEHAAFRDLASFDEDGDGDYIDGEPTEDFRCWLNCGPLSAEARAYLLGLRA